MCDAFTGQSLRVFGTTLGFFAWPTGCAVHRGILFVADGEGNNLVALHPLTGARVGQVEFNSPYCLSVDRESNILYVLDRADGVVAGISLRPENFATGIGVFGERGEGPGGFTNAVYVHADGVHGTIYVTDLAQRCLHVYHEHQGISILVRLGLRSLM
jgi:hypothetical protein